MSTQKLFLYLFFFTYILFCPASNQTLLYVKHPTPSFWRTGTIYINTDSIGFGTSPVFSHTKDRIVYIDTSNTIQIYDGLHTKQLFSLPFKRPRITLSWDKTGHIYTTQELCVIKIDTATLKIDTVFTFKDSSYLDATHTWFLCEGNVAQGRIGCFTLNRGDNSNNRIFYLDFIADTAIRLYTQYAACQAGISENGIWSIGTYFGHAMGIAISMIDTSIQNLFVKPPKNQTIWQLRFNKYNDSLLSYISTGNNNQSSHVVNFYTDSIIVKVDSIEIWDYIPEYKATFIEKKKKYYNNSKFLSGEIWSQNIYNIKGQRISSNNDHSIHPGIYFSRYGKKIKRFVVLN